MLADLKIAYQIPHAAEVSGIAERELRKLIDAGELDTIQVGNRELITRANLESFCYRRELESRHARSDHG